MLYNIHYDVCALAVSIITILGILFAKDLKRIENRVFFAVVVVASLAAVFDIISAYTISYPENYSVGFRFWINYFFLFFHNMSPVMIYSYVVFSSGVTYRGKVDWYWATALPFCVTISLFIVQLFTPVIFLFEPDLTYTHGVLFYWLYISTSLYMLFILVHLIRFRKAMPRGRAGFLVLFIGGMFVSVVVQAINPRMLIELFVQSVSYVGILVTIEDLSDVYDPKTGIYNRKSFEKECQRLIESGNHFHVAVIKIVNLPRYMSILGISAINNILAILGKSLEREHKDVIPYYLGQGNFGLIYKKSDHSVVDHMEEDLKRCAVMDWEYKGVSLEFREVIFLVHVPEEFHSIDLLSTVIDRVEPPLSTERYRFLQGDDLKPIFREQEVAQALARAQENHSFKVYYQPIWDSTTGMIHSAEALIRLFDEDMGFVPPDEFIRVAEQNGTIIEIGEFVFEEVCRFMSQNHLQDLGVEFVEVNLSTVQCMADNLPATFQRIMDKYGVSASSLNLEITESAAVENHHRLKKTMDELRAMGFTFSMDDYGTGYSNIQNIFSMDFDIIKIDKSILWDADKGVMGDVILASTIKMIKDMDRRIVTEGVETLEQRDKLVELGCDYCQGYYYSKPVPGNEFIAYVTEFNQNAQVS